MAAPMTTPFDDDYIDPEWLKPVTIGPTWQRDENGAFILPKKSLGYECLRWSFEYLQSPQGGPWRYTAEQARFVLWHYALKDDGTFLYRDMTLRRCKGAGKDFIAAALAMFEMAGPCRFSRWDDSGRPVGKIAEEPWVVIASTNKEATTTTSKVFSTIASKKLIKAYSVKIGKEVVYAMDGVAKIDTVTSSPRPMESFRPSYQLANEVHHWLKGDGHDMIEVMRRNAGKRDSRILSLTNAFRPGEDSVAEQDWHAYLDVKAGRAIDTGVLYDSLEASPSAPLRPDVIPLVLEQVRGDAVWLNVDRLTQDILDIRTPRSQSLRFHYNVITAAEDALITPQEWDQCVVDDELRDGDEVVLGLDPSKSDDSTALVAIRISDRLVQPLKIWEVPRGPAGDGYEIDMTDVDGHVASAFAKYRVRAFFSDVNPVQGYVDKWSDEYRERVMIKAAPGMSACGYDMRGHMKEITLMNEAFVGALREKTVRIVRDPVLREHALNTYQRPNGHGMSFGKESRESSRKVDAYAATLLAYIALNKYLESGRRPAEEQDGSFYIFY